jgi:hypothetical protein
MEEARMGEGRKNRPGLDIAFSVPKGRSARTYFAAEPGVDAEHSSQWGGTFAALRGTASDAVAKTMEQIEAVVTTGTRQNAQRSGSIKGQQVWMEVTHRMLPPRPQKSPKTTLWVNGVKMTPKLWKRLQAMTKEEQRAFWHEQLKNMQWTANDEPPVK